MVQTNLHHQCKVKDYIKKTTVCYAVILIKFQIAGKYAEMVFFYHYTFTALLAVNTRTVMHEWITLYQWM